MSLYQGKRFAIAEMRHRILIQEMTETFDTTSGQPTRTWSTFALKEPAAYDEVRGGESFRGSQIEANITAVFTLRYRPGYGPTMRIYHNARYYNLVFARRVRGYDRYLELHCRTVDDGAIE